MDPSEKKPVLNADTDTLDHGDKVSGTDNEVAAPESSPANHAPKTTGSGVLTRSVTLIEALALALLSSGLSGYFAYSAAMRSQTTPQIAVVDVNRLMMSKLMAMSKDSSVTPAMMAGQFIDGMGRVLDFYADHNVLVLNSEGAMNKPGSMDITQQVAGSMGITLSTAPPPITAAMAAGPRSPSAPNLESPPSPPKP